MPTITIKNMNLPVDTVCFSGLEVASSETVMAAILVSSVDDSLFSSATKKFTDKMYKDYLKDQYHHRSYFIRMFQMKT